MSAKNKRTYRSFLAVWLLLGLAALLWQSWNYLDTSIPDELFIYRDEEKPLEVLQKNPLITISDTATLAGNGSYQVECRLLGRFLFKRVKVTQMEPVSIYASGVPVGIYMETAGVMVIDSGMVRRSDGSEVSPARHILKPGDYITQMDGMRITNKKELVRLLKEQGGKTVQLRIVREGEEFPVSLKPERTADGQYKLGIWVRDSLQGIGTLTYVEEDGSFGALGHGISDVDTGKLLHLADGGLYQAQILSIVRGKTGNPGELQGIINYRPGSRIGSIERNEKIGIYGKILPQARETLALSRYEVGRKQEMHLGEASILSSSNGKVNAYTVEILKIDWNQKNSNKNFTMQVKDRRLLEETGGIVQGMSGSPVIQDGKIVGAVTHVFIQNSAKGYGIFIENMLNSAGEKK